LLYYQGSYWKSAAQGYFRLLVAYQIGTFNILLVMTSTFMELHSFIHSFIDSSIHSYISHYRQCKQYVLSRSSRRGDKDHTGKFIVLVIVKGRFRTRFAWCSRWMNSRKDSQSVGCYILKTSQERTPWRQLLHDHGYLLLNCHSPGVRTHKFNQHQIRGTASPSSPQLIY